MYTNPKLGILLIAAVGLILAGGLKIDAVFAWKGGNPDFQANPVGTYASGQGIGDGADGRDVSEVARFANGPND
jgi:hypothetical protein